MQILIIARFGSQTIWNENMFSLDIVAANTAKNMNCFHVQRCVGGAAEVRAMTDLEMSLKE